MELRLTKDIGSKMGIHPNSRARILDSDEDIHRSTDAAASRPSTSYHPPYGPKWLLNHLYGQPVQLFWHPQTA